MKTRKKILIYTTLAVVVVLSAIGGLRIASAYAATYAMQLLDEGDAFRKLGLWADAKDRYEAAIRYYVPGDLQDKAQLGLAKCLHETDPQRAIAIYEDLIERYPEGDFKAEAMLCLGQALRGVDTEAARIQFDAVRTAYPDTAVARHADVGLAQCIEDEGCLLDAFAEYNRLSGKYAGQEAGAEAAYLFAEIMLKPGVWGRPPDMQRPVLEKLINDPAASDDIRAEAMYLLALGYRNSDDPMECVRIQKELALELPHTDRALRELASLAGILMAQSGPAEARAALEEISGQPQCQGTEITDIAQDLVSVIDQPGYWLDAGSIPPRTLGARVIFYSHFDAELCIQAMEALVNQYPDFKYAPIVLEELGLAYAKLDDHETAAAWWERLAEDYPGASGAPDALNSIGVCYRNLGRYEDSIAAFQRVIDTYPNHFQAADSQFRIGQIYEYRLGDLERARDTYNTVVAQHPGTRPAEYASEALLRLAS